jgi:hypothetical protein
MLDKSVALSATDRVVQSKSVLVGEVNGQVVALDVESGQCFGLNSVGTEIWRRIETEVVVRDLCGQLCDAYDVDYTQCEVDVLGLLEDLRSEGMIEVR